MALKGSIRNNHHRYECPWYDFVSVWQAGSVTNGFSGFGSSFGPGGSFGQQQSQPWRAWESVSEACQFILKQVHTEGLFRQQKIRVCLIFFLIFCIQLKYHYLLQASLRSAQPQGKSHHVIDNGNLLKTFRNLPSRFGHRETFKRR